ncbi:prolipoprotein diacylglyceryl transferase [Patescibacteria group bacterium]
MHPILFSIGSVNVFSFSVFLIISWLVFSFTFWFMMKNYGISENKVFDLSFYGTLLAFVFSRLFYVLANVELFSDNLLKIITLWIVPGMSKYGAVFGFILFLFLYSKSKKIRLGYIADSLAFALPASFTVGSIGSLLDGTQVGKVMNLSWGVNYNGYTELRHPVQVYDVFMLLLIAIFLSYLWKKAIRKKWPYGMIGIWFFFLYGVGDFAMEFFKENAIFLQGLTPNQWISLAVVSESLGILYIKFGGRQKFAILSRSARINITKIGKGAYEKITKRILRRNNQNSK